MLFEPSSSCNRFVSCDRKPTPMSLMSFFHSLRTFRLVILAISLQPSSPTLFYSRSSAVRQGKFDIADASFASMLKSVLMNWLLFRVSLEIFARFRICSMCVRLVGLRESPISVSYLRFVIEHIWGNQFPSSNAPLRCNLDSLLSREICSICSSHNWYESELFGQYLDRFLVWWVPAFARGLTRLAPIPLLQLSSRRTAILWLSNSERW